MLCELKFHPLILELVRRLIHIIDIPFSAAFVVCRFPASPKHGLLRLLLFFPSSSSMLLSSESHPEFTSRGPSRRASGFFHGAPGPKQAAPNIIMGHL